MRQTSEAAALNRQRAILPALPLPDIGLVKMSRSEFECGLGKALAKGKGQHLLRL